MAEEIITTRTRGYYYGGSFTARVVNTVVGIIELVLLARIVLELFGANAASPFVAWVYDVSGAFIGPFIGAFPAIYLTSNSVLDIVAILAMIGYAVLGWILIEILGFIFSAASSL